MQRELEKETQANISEGKPKMNNSDIKTINSVSHRQR